MTLPRKPRKLVDLEVHAVAGVDKAANGRRFLVVKRANDASTWRERLARLFKVEGSNDPKSFDEALALSQFDDQWWRLNDALRTSIRSIIESDAEDKAALIRQSVAEYAEAVVGLATKMSKADATVQDGAMQKMHEALTQIGDAADRAMDQETFMNLVAKVEECAKAWREQIEKGDDGMPQLGTNTMNLDALLKGVSDDVKAAIKAAFEKQEQEIADLRKRLEESKGGSKPDDINKADLPEPVRKRLEELEKQAQEAERIAKAEREARIKAEIRKRAESYANVGDIEKIAKALYEVQEKLSPEVAQELEELFKSAHERIAKGELFKEFGSGTGTAVAADPVTQFDQLVQKVAQEEKIGYDEAARRVSKSHPHLAAAYIAAAPVGKE